MSPEPSAVGANRDFCQKLQGIIAGAGGGGLLEMYPCPNEAMFVGLAGNTNGPRIGEISDNLGIVGIYRDAEGDLG